MYTLVRGFRVRPVPFIAYLALAQGLMVLAADNCTQTCKEVNAWCATNAAGACSDLANIPGCKVLDDDNFTCQFCTCSTCWCTEGGNQQLVCKAVNPPQQLSYHKYFNCTSLCPAHGVGSSEASTANATESTMTGTAAQMECAPNS